MVLYNHEYCFEKMPSDKANHWLRLYLMRHESRLQTFDARWKILFPIGISGLHHFQDFTSGLSGYNRNDGNNFLYWVRADLGMIGSTEPACNLTDKMKYSIPDSASN